MRVHAVTADRGGCWWFRVFVPLDCYARTYQVDTSYGDCAPKQLLDELSDRSDPGVLVVKFITAPAALDAIEQIARAPRRPLLVYDVDDSYYHVHDMFAGEHSQYADSEVVKRAERVMARCDWVTCSTPAVANLYERVNRNVVVLPNSVPQSLFGFGSERRPDKWTIGYQCSPSHLYDLDWVTKDLVGFLLKHRDSAVHLYGPPADTKLWGKLAGVHADQTLLTPWVDNLDRFHRLLADSMHVGIAPIEPGRTFNRYKSGVKAQTYAAFGIPTVAGDTAYYRDVIRDGVTGFVVGSPREFSARLELLHKSPGLLADMGRQALLAESKRTIEKRIDLWHKVYGGEKP